MRSYSFLTGLRLHSLAAVLAATSGLASSADCSADLIAGNWSFGSVHRFDDVTGTPIGDDISFGTMNSTAGVAVGPDGNIYVSSQGTGEVLFFDGVTGEPLPSPQPGGAPGVFAPLATSAKPDSTPGPLKFSPDGTKLYVSDFGGNSVRVFDVASGAELAPAAVGITPPGGIAFAPNGELYVGNFGTAAVVRVHNGALTPVITPGSSPLLTPSALLFLPNSDLLVVDMFGNRVLRYTQNGAYLGVFATIEPADAGTNYPSDIAYDADGNLVLAVLGATNPPDNRGQLLRFDLNGNQLGAPLVDAHPPLSSVAWISSVDAVTGDYNGDGLVNSADYDKWKTDFGKWVAQGGGADGNGNGIVDAADYTVWRDHFGEGILAGAAGAAAVPEPSTTLLATAGMLLAASFRRRS